MYDSALYFPIGQARASTNSHLDGALGAIYFTPTGKAYRLCKNTTALALAASKCLVTAFSAGAPTWNVDLAGAVVTTDNIIVVPTGQVGSGSTTTTLAAGDYFWGQVSGPCSFLPAATTTVKTEGEGLSVNSLGYVVQIAAVTTASTVVVPGSTLRATNTAAASTVAVAITGFIASLI